MSDVPLHSVNFCLIICFCRNCFVFLHNYCFYRIGLVLLFLQQVVLFCFKGFGCIVFVSAELVVFCIIVMLLVEDWVSLFALGSVQFFV